MSFSVRCPRCAWHGRRKDFAKGCPECGHRPLLPRMSEAEFMAQVIAFAKMHGWAVVHFRPAMTKRGWRTPVEGDAKGFVDLVLVKRRVIFAEVKADDGHLSAEQQEWAKRLEVAGQPVVIWRPRDWNAVQSELRT